MSANLPSLYAQQFATTLMLLLQQKGSKLRNLVTFKGDYIGKQVSPVDQIGAIEMQPVASRYAPMGRVDAPVDRRWVTPLDFDLPQLVDSFDKLRLLNDPNSAYVQNALFAAGRKLDDLIIDAFFADAKTGETGSGTTVFPSAVFPTGNSVGVSFGGTTTGLTVPKLKRARRILVGNEVDIEADPITCVLTAAQEENLLNEYEATSRDFNPTDRPVLKEGMLDRFLGMNFVRCERLDNGTDDAAGTSRQVPVFAKSGMHLAMWADVTTDVSQRKDLQGLPWQVYVYMTANATRLEEKKTVRIWARES
jgi:hypothetical protein